MTDEAPEPTPGYVPPRKVSLQMQMEQDKDDDSLTKWKNQLLAGASAASSSTDTRNVIIKALRVCVEGRPDVVMELDTPGKGRTVAKVAGTRFILKEGALYTKKMDFVVQGDIVAGLKYMEILKSTRPLIPKQKYEYMLGSFPPREGIQSFTFPEEETPTGMMARGTWEVKSKFVDDDNATHLEFSYLIDIKKDWS